MALPLAMLKTLQISPRAKLGLVAIFGLASFIIVFDILRTTETLGHSQSIGSTALWTDLESAIAIIVSCLPSFVALLRPRKGNDVEKNTSRYPSRPLAISVSAKQFMDTSGSVKHVDGGQVCGSDRSSHTTNASLELIAAQDSSGKDTSTIC